MEALKEKILNEGTAIGKDIIKVDGFLNHQIDAKFLERIGREFAARFADCRIDRILTVEASGIAIAVGTAPFIGYPPVVFAKKATPNTMTDGQFEVQAKSFTKGTVSKLVVSEKYLKEGENVLILASGNVVHNLRMVRWESRQGSPEAVAFNSFITAAVERRDDEAVILMGSFSTS